MTIAPLLGSNAVVQAGRPLRVWGFASPGQTVRVTCGNEARDCSAQADGRWETEFSPAPYGARFDLSASAEGATVHARNLIAGDVYLCSGQSNMEWPLRECADGAAEIARASRPTLRFFETARIPAARPQEICGGQWRACTPDTAASIYGVAYFFARRLLEERGHPIGLILSAWGGTRIAAYLPEASLELPQLVHLKSELPDPKADLAAELAALEKEFAGNWEKFWAQFYLKDPGNIGESRGWATEPCAEPEWSLRKLPAFWQEHPDGPTCNGAAWFRLALDLPDADAGADATLELGAIDDFDTTYFNGQRIGGIGEETPDAFAAPRRYTVPGSLIRPGANTIAVRVFDRFGRGGFAGPASAMRWTGASGQEIPLAGTWHFRMEHMLQPRKTAAGSPPIMAARPQDLPAVLFNARIHPVLRHPLAGVLWYQGESDAGRAALYRIMFPELIRSWRALWQQPDLPFYFVQLANFMARAEAPVDSEWAELRDAQAAALALPHTGMAVTLDVGDADDIHPRDKSSVGERLARIALHRSFHLAVPDSGPTFAEVHFIDGRARVRFDHADGLTTSDGTGPTGFAVASADRTFHWASATIQTNGWIELVSAAVTHPVAVRYAWAANPRVNLINQHGLPAAPFRTDDWPGITEGKR